MGKGNLYVFYSVRGLPPAFARGRDAEVSLIGAAELIELAVANGSGNLGKRSFFLNQKRSSLHAKRGQCLKGRGGKLPCEELS